jgi:pimeloyl-ACP methyl ester carboxylesterase
MTDHALTEGGTTVNGVDLVWLEAGEGPLALCQHGFPDTAWGWRHVLPALAAAGFRAVAPFARGYAPSAPGPDHCGAVSAWVADVCALHDQLGGGEPAVLVGHDWGALTAYGAAAFAPERWSRIVAASVPPAAVMAGHLFDYDQIKRFWYQYVLVRPEAEAIVAHDDFAFLRGLWADWSPGYDADDDLPPVIEALRGGDHLSTALHSYRSMYDLTLQPAEFAEQAMAVLTPHSQPTLYLHGSGDGCVGVEIAEQEVAAALPAGSRVEIIEGAGHFLQYEQPERVRDLIVEWATA